jgi:hypothetical protein
VSPSVAAVAAGDTQLLCEFRSPGNACVPIGPNCCMRRTKCIASHQFQNLSYGFLCVSVAPCESIPSADQSELTGRFAPTRLFLPSFEKPIARRFANLTHTEPQRHREFAGIAIKALKGWRDGDTQLLCEFPAAGNACVPIGPETRVSPSVCVPIGPNCCLRRTRCIASHQFQNLSYGFLCVSVAPCESTADLANFASFHSGLQTQTGWLRRSVCRKQLRTTVLRCVCVAPCESIPSAT